MNRRIFLLGAAAVVAVGGTGAYFWQTREVLAAGPVFAGKTPGIAINGYDTVAYITEGKPVEGSDAYTHSWKGVTWRFASAENKALFEANPEKYAPQYGGFCAYAVAKGSTAKTEPDAFTVVDNKLYLNYDKNVQSLWEGDIPKFIEDGDKNWVELSKNQ
jgi:YHS domain-containing protein